MTEEVQREANKSPLVTPTLRKAEQALLSGADTLALDATVMVKATTLSFEAGRPRFEPMFAAQTEKYLGAAVAAEWADEVVTTAASCGLSFAWSGSLQLQSGQQAVEGALRAWYDDPKRIESHKSWPERLYAELDKHAEKLLGPTLQHAQQTLTKAIQQNQVPKATTQVRGARLYLHLDGAPDTDLLAAIESVGIVKFLSQMAMGKPVEEVTAAEFRAPCNPQETDPAKRGSPKSWYYQAQGSKTAHNKKHVKKLFRDAVDGHHEWLPCDKIISIVEDADKHSDPQKGAQWIELQHRLRSDTSDVVFRPSRGADVDAKLLAILQQTEGLEDREVEIWQRVRGEDGGVQARELQLSGHVGAFYLEVDGEKEQQTGVTDEFHKELNGLWRFELDLDDYVDALEDHLLGEDTPLWDGTLKQVIPEEFVPYAHTIASDYTSKGRKSWGDDLQELSENVAKSYERVKDMFNTVEIP
jgi:hypothetical protein